MLTSTGFGNNSGFAHAFRQQNLTKTIVNFVRTGMVQFVSLQIDFGAITAANLFGQPLSKI